MVLPSVQPIAAYFTDDFAFANGIGLGGASIGMMALPPLSELFVEMYGWRGALVLIAAIDAHAIFAGLLMRIPDTEEETHNETKRQGVVYTKLIDTQTPTKEQTIKKKLSFKDVLIESFDIKMFGEEPLVMFYDVIILIFAIVYATWTVFLVPHAVTRGISPQKAALLSTIAGATNFFGRIAYAPLVDVVDSRDAFAAVSAVLAIVFIIDSWLDTYEAMAVSAAITGCIIGAGNSLWTVMIKAFVDECGSGSFVSTLGWACMFSGVGSMISSPIAGNDDDKMNRKMYNVM